MLMSTTDHITPQKTNQETHIEVLKLELRLVLVSILLNNLLHLLATYHLTGMQIDNTEKQGYLLRIIERQKKRDKSPETYPFAHNNCSNNLIRKNEKISRFSLTTPPSSFVLQS